VADHLGHMGNTTLGESVQALQIVLKLIYQLSTKASRQSTLGYTHGSSLLVAGAQATNSMVTQDTDKVFIQVRPPCGRNTYVLCLIVLNCVEMSCLGGSLASPYKVQRAGLQI